MNPILLLAMLTGIGAAHVNEHVQEVSSISIRNQDRDPILDEIAKRLNEGINHELATERAQYSIASQSGRASVVGWLRSDCFSAPPVARQQSPSSALAKQIDAEFVVALQPLVVIVSPESPVKTILALIRSTSVPGREPPWATGAPGSATHRAALALGAQSNRKKIELRAYLQPLDGLSLLAHGKVGAMVLPLSHARDSIRQRQVLVLGISSAARHPTLGWIPSIGESIPGFRESCRTILHLDESTTDLGLRPFHRTVLRAIAQPTFHEFLHRRGFTQAVTPH